VSRPVAEAVLGIALLSVMDAIIKGLVQDLAVVQVAFLRYVVGSAVMVALATRWGPGWPSPRTIRANAVRAVLVVVTATSFFYGIGALPLAEALVLSFVSPVFTAMFAVALLGERLDRRIGAALGAGFAGVLLIVAGGGHGASGFGGGGTLLGVVAILLSSVTYAASNVLLRARAQRDPLLHIVLVQNVAPGLMLAVPAFLFWRTPHLGEAWRLALVGCLGVAGHLLLARAYAGAEATRLAPLEYTSLIWATLIGYLAFAEVPTLWVFAGGTLIVAGAAIASRRRSAVAAAPAVIDPD